MAAQNDNSIKSQFVEQASETNLVAARALSITRLAKNVSGHDIAASAPFFTAIKNVGWDDVENCMLISPIDSTSDVVLGICISPIKDNEVRRINYVSNGIIGSIDTSAWDINDLLYVKTDGTLTSEVTENSTDIIPQEVALVMRKHAAYGEIYVSAMASQVRYFRQTLAILQARDAKMLSGDDGPSVYIKGGYGDTTDFEGPTKGGDIELIPGAQANSASANPDRAGRVIVRPGGGNSEIPDYFDLWHNTIETLCRSVANGVLAPFVHLTKLVARYYADTGRTKQVEISHDGTKTIVNSASGAISVQMGGVEKVNISTTGQVTVTGGVSSAQATIVGSTQAQAFYNHSGASSGNKVMQVVYTNGGLSIRSLSDDYNTVQKTPITINFPNELVTVKNVTVTTALLVGTTNVMTAINAKADANHVHQQMLDDIDAVELALGGKSDIGHQHSFSEVSNGSIDIGSLVDTKANIDHVHQVMLDDIDGLEVTVAGKADAAHTHSFSDVSNGSIDLGSLLDQKASIGHVHQQMLDDIDAAELAISGKSDIGHTHSFSDVSNGSIDIGSLVDTKANIDHVHQVMLDDIDGLEVAVAGKSDIGHTHSFGDVSNGSIDLGSLLDQKANTSAISDMLTLTQAYTIFATAAWCNGSFIPSGQGYTGTLNLMGDDGQTPVTLTISDGIITGAS